MVAEVKVVREGICMHILIKGEYSRYTVYTHAYVYGKVVEKPLGVSLSEVGYVLTLHKQIKYWSVCTKYVTKFKMAARTELRTRIVATLYGIS